MTLGICDWGIGGLGLYDLLKKSRPDIQVAYIGDQGSMSYSLMSKEALADRVRQIELAFLGLGINRVVFACDAASTALDEVNVAGVKASGVIEPTLRAMRTRKYRDLGVIGGRRTILSGAYGRALRKLRFSVVQRVSLDLSLLIENGSVNEPRTRELLEGVLEPLAKVDGLVLACTHYRLVAGIIQGILPGAEIIDPVDIAVADLIQSLPHDSVSNGADVFYSTGDPQLMRQRTSEIYGLDITVEPLHLYNPSMAA